MIALGPIFSSLKKNSLGALLIALQIAITLAILANSLHIIEARVNTLAEPTGLIEDNLFSFDLQTAVPLEAQPAEREADLSKLRALPGVSSAYATNALPLGWSGWSMGLRLSKESDSREASSAIYFADQHTIATLGTSLLSGRNFSAQDLTNRGPQDLSWPSSIIVTESLATRLFDTQDAVGKSVYIGDVDSPSASPSTIVGVIKDVRSPWRGWNDGWLSQVLLAPQNLLGSGRFMVRTQAGQMAAAMGAVQETMLSVNPERVVTEPKSFAQTRASFYRNDTAMVAMLVAVIAALALVTAFGIFGMVSFWVTQRRKQIGTRRALGATKTDILLHFMAENFLIVSIGILLGWALAIGLNIWLSRSFEMERLGFGWIMIGSLGVYLVGQLATLYPAREAASVAPVVATRGA